jgi:hypothetical protein
MALKPCKECSREISTEAKTCPHCGKKDPTGTHTSPVAMGCLVLVLLGVIGSLLSPSKRSDSSIGDAPSASPLQASSSPAPATPPPAGSQWEYSHNPDEMTGNVSHTASVQSENTVEFDFPYQGAQHGRLTIRRHPRFGNDVIFGIERGQLLCPSYDGCSVLVRFDDGQPQSFSANPPADHSSETIFIANYERFVTRMRSAKVVRISPKIYQQGNVVFTFAVDGFDTKRFRGE